MFFVFGVSIALGLINPFIFFLSVHNPSAWLMLKQFLQVKAEKTDAVLVVCVVISQISHSCTSPKTTTATCSVMAWL